MYTIFLHGCFYGEQSCPRFFFKLMVSIRKAGPAKGHTTHMQGTIAGRETHENPALYAWFLRQQRSKKR